jgi:hydrogenase maturation protease
VTSRTLVAGIGNVFLGDDGFGVEVARALGGQPLPEGVHVEDYGIRGVHLAYALLDGYDELVLVDALQRHEEPGTLVVLEPDLPDPDELGEPEVGAPVVDAHVMGPDAMLALVCTLTPRLGGTVPRVRVVGCQPAVTDEVMGLSPPVAGAVEEAARLVCALVSGEELAATSGRPEHAEPRGRTGPQPHAGREGHARGGTR